MHLLRHPRNAALLGIIFVVIAIIYLVVPYVAGQNMVNHGHLRGRHDALRPRDRDGDHGLRAGGGNARRMTHPSAGPATAAA